MNTTNLISTPNIVGNIGSCSPQSVNTKVGDSFWTADYTTVITNSCTGNVISNNTYTDHTFVDVVGAGAIFLFVFAFAVAIASSSSSSY